MKSIIKAIKDGWQSGGIQWREEFIKKNINPDSFLELPGAKDLLAQYLALQDQNKVIFLNTIYRKFPFLRND